MRKRLPVQQKAETAQTPTFSPLPPTLERKSVLGESQTHCDACREDRLTPEIEAGSGFDDSLSPQTNSLSNSNSKGAGETDFGHDFARLQVLHGMPGSDQANLTINRPGDPYETEADHAVKQADKAMRSSRSEKIQPLPLRLPFSHTGLLIQRQAQEPPSAGSEAETAPAGPSAAEASKPETAASDEASSKGLIVEDDAIEVGPGKIRKSNFLDELDKSVCAIADAELASVGRSTEACPYIDKWLGYYRTRSAAQIERALNKFAPETSGTTSARDYIGLASERVRRAVSVWAKTGEIEDVPAELLGQMSEAEAGAGEAGAATEGGSSGESGGQGMLFKAQHGGAKSADPRSVQGRLGAGTPISTDVRTRVEPLFGYDFSQVRVHSDSKAAALSKDLNARAFTVGKEIAFAAGEYKPGTPVGDALITHELAHVVQQGGAGAAAQPTSGGSSGQNALEEDADASAAGAVVSLWSGVKGSVAEIAQNAMPRLKSGLKLQRCKDGSKEEKKKAAIPDPSKMTDAAIEATTEYKAYMDPALQWQTKFKMTRDEALLACRLIIRQRGEGKTVTFSTDAEAFMNLARKQSGTLAQATGLKGKLQWVPFSSTAAAQDPSQLQSDFGKWLLAGGPEPDPMTGKVNCWEMVLFSAYKGGFTPKARLEAIYNEGARQIRAGTRQYMGDTIEAELRRGNEYILKAGDPDSPEPLPGDIVIFTKAKDHVAISLGTKDSSGRHKIISHWPPPDNKPQVKETTIEELLPSVTAGNLVKFWSPAW